MKDLKVGDLVKMKHYESVWVGIVIEIKPHPYLSRNGNLCKVQWPHHAKEVMCSWLEVINEDR